jgi:hypothetical protein
MGPVATILWRRLDRPGMDAAKLADTGDGWELSGTAVFEHDGDAAALDYAVLCDAGWRTRRAVVRGWIGPHGVDLRIDHGGIGIWRYDGREVPAVAGCVDLDLNFSPATNLLPIRRLDLAIGGEEAVVSAWLRFPGLALEPLEQVYRRTGESTYAYGSATGFEATFETNADGFVVRYPGFAEAIASR